MANVVIGLQISKKNRILLDKICLSRGEDLSDFVRRSIRKVLARLNFLSAEDKEGSNTEEETKDAGILEKTVFPINSKPVIYVGKYPLKKPDFLKCSDFPFEYNFFYLGNPDLPIYLCPTCFNDTRDNERTKYNFRFRERGF